MVRVAMGKTEQLRRRKGLPYLCPISGPDRREAGELFRVKRVYPDDMLVPLQNHAGVGGQCDETGNAA